MSSQNQDTEKHAGRRPDIDLRDGALRSATWLTPGENRLLSSTAYTRTYPDKEGQLKVTSNMRSQDHAPLIELIRETRLEIVQRERAYKRGLREERETSSQEEWHAEDASRGDVKRERFKKERSDRGTRRPKPRDRSAR